MGEVGGVSLPRDGKPRWRSRPKAVVPAGATLRPNPDPQGACTPSPTVWPRQGGARWGHSPPPSTPIPTEPGSRERRGATGLARILPAHPPDLPAPSPQRPRLQGNRKRWGGLR